MLSCDDICWIKASKGNLIVEFFTRALLPYLTDLAEIKGNFERHLNFTGKKVKKLELKILVLAYLLIAKNLIESSLFIDMLLTGWFFFSPVTIIWSPFHFTRRLKIKRNKKYTASLHHHRIFSARWSVAQVTNTIRLIKTVTNSSLFLIELPAYIKYYY